MLQLLLEKVKIKKSLILTIFNYSVLLVLSNVEYMPEDYIHDFEQFKKLKK